LRHLQCDEIILHVKRREAIGADAVTVASGVGAVAHSQTARRCPPRDGFGLPTSPTPAGPRLFKWNGARFEWCSGARAVNPSMTNAPHLLPFGRQANPCSRQRSCRRRKPDRQKQRTSPSACARLSSLIAALACSGDWNMVPNRPGTCERLKNVSAAT